MGKKSKIDGASESQGEAKEKRERRGRLTLAERLADLDRSISRTRTMLAKLVARREKTIADEKERVERAMKEIDAARSLDQVAVPFGGES